MANTIGQLSTANTFLQWLTASQGLITATNDLREGGSANTFLANTNIEISGNLLVDGYGFSANANVRPGVTTFSVTNSGSSAYLFDQYPGNNPDIYLHPGQTVSFNLNVPGHPFMIRVSPGGANYDTGLTHVSTAGIVTTEAGAQAKVTGTLIWKVPYSLVDTTYVYQCAVHSGMVGNLIIQNTVTGAIAAIANVAGESIAFAIALG
jgi:plastocyanin